MSESVVVDKSYLLGAPSTDLENLFRTKSVLMTEALFYELLTTDPVQRARCFRRIPKTTNPVTLVPNVGPILRWEVDNHTPLCDLHVLAIQESFRFNPRLVEPEFELSTAQSTDLTDWNANVLDWARDFADHAGRILEFYPQLIDYRPGQNPQDIEDLKARISNDADYVRSLYVKDGEGWPEASEIDETWALFRWLQIRFLGALDYFRQYGPGAMQAKLKTIENEYLDLEYCLAGCICGALATRDERMASRFLGITKSGALYGPRQKDTAYNAFNADA